ncbi:MAG: hypothetical protein K6F98_06755 [Bacteroidales bacterium]|nr:hypothetical protein [Bacteroidales bacterium]
MKTFMHIATAALAAVLSMHPCMAAENGKQDKPLILFFESDVHGAVNGYPLLAGYRNAVTAADTAYVGTVCVGDFMHGSEAVTADGCACLPAILNAVGYDVITLGNHEFDRPVTDLKKVLEQVRTSVICCNLTDVATGETVYPPSVMKQFGPVKVGFVGALTPMALRIDRTGFYDAEGKQLYDVKSDEIPALVQAETDKLRAAGADYVVLLSHLGESSRMGGMSSVQVIGATNGIDAVLDSHTHSVIPQQTAPNKDGKDIVYAQTGNKMANIGQLTIRPDGSASTCLIPVSSITLTDEKVAAAVSEALSKTSAE